MRVHWSECVCVCVCVCERERSSYLIAKITYYLEEEFKGLKIVLSLTNRYKKFSNFDACFDIFILKRS